jgi:N-acetylglucosaminyl-diphospho-decaprenol L-rhamnosyltransferase
MLSVVVLAYNSAGVIGPCLASLPERVPVILVDNASRDDTLSLARRARPEARLIALADNRGFAGGANAGLAAAETPLALLLNADARLRPGALDALAAAADRYPDAALFAPSTWDAAGRLQFGRQPLFGAWCTNDGEAVLPEGDCCASYLAGAAMCFRLDAFRRIGGFDEAIFFYFEDDDICFRLARAGWSLVHVAQAHVDHLSGRSSAGVDGLDYWKEWHRAWSRLHMEEKHRGHLAAHRLALVKLPQLGLKTLGYRLLGQADKVRRYGGRLAGTWGYLGGREARRVGLGGL